jgi:hypothetical protein
MSGFFTVFAAPVWPVSLFPPTDDEAHQPRRETPQELIFAINDITGF